MKSILDVQTIDCYKLLYLETMLVKSKLVTFLITD